MDQQRFSEALDAVSTSGKGSGDRAGGIGTLGEKSLHAVLKHYMEPYTGSHEVRIGRYVADIVGEHGIVEIQTRSFDRLRDKLAAFLDVAEVTVVYPVAQTKWLSWLEPATGEVVSRRKSPKQGKPWEICYELYKIKHLLRHPGLRLHILLLEVEEYRFLNGWSVNKKKGSSRAERIPTALVGEVLIESLPGYCQLLPADLPCPFTTADYRKAGKLSLSASQTALNVLHHVGAVERVGKRGNAYLYLPVASQ